MYKVTSFFIGRYQETYFDKAVVMRANWVFIAKTPFDKLYNTSVIPKIVPIDKRTMLVDTKNLILYLLEISVNWQFLP